MMISLEDRFFLALRGYVDARAFYRNHLSDIKALVLEERAELELRAATRSLLASPRAGELDEAAP